MSVAERLSALTPEQRALFEALRRKQQESQAAKPLLPPPVRRVTGPTAAGDWPLAIDQERLDTSYFFNTGAVGSVPAPPLGRAPGTGPSPFGPPGQPMVDFVAAPAAARKAEPRAQNTKQPARRSGS